MMANFFDQFDRLSAVPSAPAAPANFFDQFDTPANTPNTPANTPNDIVPGSVTTTPARDGRPTRVIMDMGQGAPAPSPQPQPAASTPNNSLTQLTIDFLNQGSAAGQRTTPNIGAQSKNLVSDQTFENELGEVLYRDPQTGQVVPTNTATQVALRDPVDGKIKVFARTPDTDEGVLSASGRMLMTGLATGAPVTRAVTAAAPAAAAERSIRPGQEVIAAADRLGIDVPRAIASDSTAVQRIGQGIRNIPVVGDRIPQATQRLADDLGDAVFRTADQFGQGSGPNVAHRAGNTIGAAADAETAAATRAAQQTDEAATAAWEAANSARAQALDQADAGALQASRQAVGDLSPQDMGQALIARLRSGEKVARARKDALYNIAGNSDAAIAAESAQAVRARVAQSLESDGRVIDGVLTPASARMMDELQRFSTLNIENRAVGARLPTAAGEEPVKAAVSMRGIEQTRKRLNALSRAATNDADRSAARMIIREFDSWIDDAFDNALFSGSEDALNAIKSARAANTEWRSRFFNNADDAGKIINKIVTGEITPQEVANWVIGASKVGAKGVSSRFLTRLAEATGGDAQAMQAIRGGIWNRLSQATAGADAKGGVKAANEIYEFLNGSGRDIANRLFTAEQRSVMRAYADTVRTTAAQRKALPGIEKATKPAPTEVGIGPMQELANAVLGRSGRTDEALFAAINAYAKSGGRGDIQTLSRLVKALPQQDRGDLAGAIIRQVGISPRTGQFSPDVFASQWRTYTPQAKAILFGNAGAHRQALDDIMVISERMKQIGNRFGNRSGTAQGVNFFAMGAGAMAAPLTTLTAALGGTMVARILAAPATASSASKWSRAYFALRMQPTSQRLAAYNTASRNLINTAGIRDVTVSDFLRALQSPYPSAADEQPEVPRVPTQ